MRLRQLGKNNTLQLVAMIGAAAALTLVSGYLAGNDHKTIIVLLFAGIPLCLLALRYFKPLVLAIPAVSLLVRYSLPTGTYSRVSAVMLLVMLLSGVWIATSLVQGRFKLVKSPLNAPLITFMAICSLSLVWSVVFRDPMLLEQDNFLIVQLGALAAMVLSPLAALLIANFVTTPRQLWYIAGLFISVGIAHSYGRALGLTIEQLNTRGLFPLWFTSVAYAVLIAQPGLRLRWRVLLGITLLVHLYVVGFIGIIWLSGWIPPLIAILAITLFRSKIAFIVLLAAVVWIISWQWDFLYTEVYLAGIDDGGLERFILWRNNMELVQNHPLLGVGPAGYAIYYLTYHPDEARSTHNNYLDIIAQTGILGSLCWLWIVAASIRESWVTLRDAPRGGLRTLALASAGGLAGSVVAMQLGDWIIPFAYNQTIEGYRYTIFSWIFLGVLMSIRQLVAPPLKRENRLYRRSPASRSARPAPRTAFPGTGQPVGSRASASIAAPNSGVQFKQRSNR